MSDAPAGKMWEAISVRERRKGAVIALGLLGVACALIWWSQFVDGYLAERWWYVWPFPAGLLPIAAAFWFRKRRLVPTPQSAAEHAAKMAETERKQREMEDRWWFRYPMAALFLWGAWYIAEKRPGAWWLAVVAVLLAAFMAREVSLFLLGLALLGAVLGGLAALPVPLAVVIAGALIAYAVYRTKDPTIDTRLPIVGKFIARRREAKQAAEVLKNPYIATLDTAVRFYWTENAFMQQSVNDELRANIHKQLIEEGLAIAQAENPVQTLREHLAEAVLEAAKFQVLVLPPAPEEDTAGLRGRLWMSGELKGQLFELAQKSKALREWLHAFGKVNDWDDVWNPVLYRHWITLTRANVLSALRKPLEDAHPVSEMDWYRPFFESQCAYQEHVYREALGWPSNLGSNAVDASIDALKLSLYVNCVIQGAKYPDLDYKDRMEKIAKGDDE